MVRRRGGEQIRGPGFAVAAADERHIAEASWPGLGDVPERLSFADGQAEVQHVD